MGFPRETTPRTLRWSPDRSPKRKGLAVPEDVGPQFEVDPGRLAILWFPREHASDETVRHCELLRPNLGMERRKLYVVPPNEDRARGLEPKQVQVNSPWIR